MFLKRPPRKKCSSEGCTKVAVRGGVCISHGARKNRCLIEGCEKGAIYNGMCKNHRDITDAMKKLGENLQSFSSGCAVEGCKREASLEGMILCKRHSNLANNMIKLMKKSQSQTKLSAQTEVANGFGTSETASDTQRQFELSMNVAPQARGMSNSFKSAALLTPAELVAAVHAENAARKQGRYSPIRSPLI